MAPFPDSVPINFLQRQLVTMQINNCSAISVIVLLRRNDAIMTLYCGPY